MDALYCDINMKSCELSKNESLWLSSDVLVYLVNNKGSVIFVSILSTRFQQKSSGKRESQLRKTSLVIHIGKSPYSVFP